MLTYFFRADGGSTSRNDTSDAVMVRSNDLALADAKKLLATSDIFLRFFRLPKVESMEISIELTLIASLLGRFLER